MRRYPVFTILACLVVPLVVGCSGGKITPISAPRVDAPGKWWAGKDIPTQGRIAKQVNIDINTGTYTSSIGSIGSNKTYREVENRIASNRDAWVKYCANPVELSGEKGDAGLLIDTSITPAKPNMAVTDQAEIDRVNRKYSAELFNARLKILLLEERMTTADSDRKKLLNEKLNDAKAQLASVENACKAEIDGRMAAPIGGRPFAMENTVPMTQ